MAERPSGDPLDWPTWSQWSYAMEELGYLTLSEVNERLALEYQLLGIYGLHASRCDPR